mgnify:CR=1 FL=1
MNRILSSSSTLCLLLALAACSLTGRRGTDSAAAARIDAVTTAAAPPEAEGVASEASSRADDLLAKGNRLQAQGRCREALQHYGMASLEAGPTQGLALAATHLCHWQLQRPKAAEESFTLFLRHELDNGRLPVRLLFQPGEARYLSDVRISAPYGMWLRRIAEATLASNSCLTLNGHAGPSAVEQYAAELPLRRAQAVQHQLESIAPALKSRLRSQAAQLEEPAVGSASDDLRDALDRRVDFTLRAC